MLIVVAVNLGVALEAHRYRIVDRVRSTFGCWNDVVGFDLRSTEAVTDAAPPVTSHEQLLYIRA